jgi:hypothetical protein
MEKTAEDWVYASGEENFQGGAPREMWGAGTYKRFLDGGYDRIIITDAR